MSDFVQKRVQDRLLVVVVSVVIIKGDNEPPRTAPANAMAQGLELQPPTTSVKTVFLEQLPSDSYEPGPVHDDPPFSLKGCFIGKKALHAETPF
jgi:hypothetical protein